MNSIFTFLLGSAIVVPLIYFFSPRNKTLSNYKEYIEQYGHKFEANEVITEDGYILSLWHLVPDFPVDKEKVVFFQPGFAAIGLCYFGLGEKSLPYLLQEEGYDIWIGNNRGTSPSKKHISKNPNNLTGDYWDFSIDDFIKYDLISEINYIKNRTGANKIDFIGYSEGSSLFLMLYMDNPKFVESSINKFISIGTIPNLSDVKISVSNFIDKVFNYLKITELFSKVFYITDSARTALITSLEKDPTFLYNILIKNEILTNRTTYKDMIHFFSYYPESTSIYHIYHWEEIQANKKIIYYKPNSNALNSVKEYNSYVIKTWKIRSLFTRSTKDGLSSYKEVTKLYEEIENKNQITLFDCHYAHFDFILAKSAYEEIYIPLVKFLDDKN